MSAVLGTKAGDRDAEAWNGEDGGRAVEQHDHCPRAYLGHDVAMFRGLGEDQAAAVGGLRVDPADDR
jgi:hypothetical protein